MKNIFSSLRKYFRKIKFWYFSKNFEISKFCFLKKKILRFSDFFIFEIFKKYSSLVPEIIFAVSKWSKSIVNVSPEYVQVYTSMYKVCTSIYKYVQHRYVTLQSSRRLLTVTQILSFQILENHGKSWEYRQKSTFSSGSGGLWGAGRVLRIVFRDGGGIIRMV